MEERGSPDRTPVAGLIWDGPALVWKFLREGTDSGEHGQDRCHWECFDVTLEAVQAWGKQ